MRNYCLSVLICFYFNLHSQKNHFDVLIGIENKINKYELTAMKIWDLAEMGYQEKESSALLQKLLKEEGFVIESGLAGIPTAFVASYGSGYPEIAILGEYDALPGLSQKAKPYKISNNHQHHK